MGIKKNNKYVKEIEKNGFVIIKNLISKNECDKFKKLLENYHKKYHKKYAFDKKNKSSLAVKNLEKVVFNLHNKDLIWFKLFQNKTIIDILDVILKKGSFKNSEPYYLNNISARTPLKGNKGQQINGCCETRIRTCSAISCLGGSGQLQVVLAREN